MISTSVILSSAYLPNIQYITKLLLYKEAVIDIHETYLKQSYRNRCEIYGANGKQDLSIPVIKPYGNKSKTKDILIDYSTSWQQIHWRAIISAYKNSPFFEFFECELNELYELKDKFLIDYNLKALMLLTELLDINFNIKYSVNYIKSDSIDDFRTSIHPKERLKKPDKDFEGRDYYQVFSNKHGFISNLSFIDLMFNEGPQAISICRQSIQDTL